MSKVDTCRYCTEAIDIYSSTPFVHYHEECFKTAKLLSCCLSDCLNAATSTGLCSMHNKSREMYKRPPTPTILKKVKEQK
jgi:hypothetical protein